MFQLEEVEKMYLEKLREESRPFKRDLLNGSFSSLESAKKMAATNVAYEKAAEIFSELVKQINRS